jgi:hypothetical protein
MIRWGIGIILLGLLVALFFGGGAGGQLVDVGKYIVGIGVFVWVIYMIFGRWGGPGTRTGGPIDPL